jgi:hypothetical protein
MMNWKMLGEYLNKEGVSLVFLSRYLLALDVGEKIDTIEEQAKQLNISVGYVSKALRKIEKERAVTLSKGGRNGTILTYKDSGKLFELSGITKLICSMPLPYTKKYEGLSSGLKEQLPSVYFAYMNGANVRAECLKKGIYDMAIMSKLAASKLANCDKYQIALDLGPQSYTTGHRLIYRKGEKEEINVIGIDYESPDQVILTETLFAGRNIKFIHIDYFNGINAIKNGVIDAIVWEVKDTAFLELINLESELVEHEHRAEFSSAVVLVKKEDLFLSKYLQSEIYIDKILSHQRAVCERLIMPSY